MSQAGKTFVCILAGLSVCAGAGAITADNPYQAIVERNVFGLKDPPPPPSTEPPKAPPPPVTITGITTILGGKRVILKTAAVGGKTPEQSYILKEGERADDIEVLQIDEKAGSARIVYAGSQVTLDFEKNGPKLLAAPPPMVMPGAVPGVPGTAGIAQPPSIPSPTAGGTFTAPNLGTKANIPSRSLRMPGTMNSAAAQGGAVPIGAGLGTVGTGLQTAQGTVAVGTLGAAPVNPGQFKSWPPERQLTPEEHDVMVEVQRAMNDPNSPPLPPTSINPNAGQQANQGGTTRGF